jgi:hypothetical protein
MPAAIYRVCVIIIVSVIKARGSSKSSRPPSLRNYSPPRGVAFCLDKGLRGIMGGWPEINYKGGGSKGFEKKIGSKSNL